MRKLSSKELSQTSGGTICDAVCYALAVGTGFWPIGTLLFGPSALGCVLFYALDAPCGRE